MLKFLIVGSGFFGSVCARELTDAGHKCIIIEKRNHIGGNAYTEDINSIHVHKYGPHIFHTNSSTIWNWINRFAEFNNFQYNPIANYNNELYALPFNMFTFNKLWNVNTPQEAKEKINSQKYYGPVNNLEDQALSLFGSDLYEKFIKEYTRKQWSDDPKNLPAFIIKRLPIRFSYNNNYFNDRYQGIPIGGYTKLFEKMTYDIYIEKNYDFFTMSDFEKGYFDYIIYTGPIDVFFEYKYGRLDYRSLRWETKILDRIDDYQGCSVMNFTSNSVDYTRCIEHKYFDYQQQRNTIISCEFPQKHSEDTEPFYPINNDNNNTRYNMYYEETKKYPNIIFGGRLAEFRYYDMHQVIASALKKIEPYVK